MSAFGALLDTLLGDPNLGVDIVYRPASGSPVACRASFAQPDFDVTVGGGARVRDRKRDLLVKAVDVAQPAKDATVEVPAGGPAHRVVDFSANDPMRLTWRITLAPS